MPAPLKQPRAKSSPRRSGRPAREATTSQLIDQLEAGLPYSRLTHIQDELELSTDELYEVLRISARTLTRRKQEGRLNIDESERLMRLGRLIDLAAGLFEGDRPGAVQWLRSPARALGGATPLHMARTEPGARAVEALIWKLEHGVFV